MPQGVQDQGGPGTSLRGGASARHRLVPPVHTTQAAKHAEAMKATPSNPGKQARRARGTHIAMPGTIKPRTKTLESMTQCVVASSFTVHGAPRTHALVPRARRWARFHAIANTQGHAVAGMQAGDGALSVSLGGEVST